MTFLLEKISITNITSIKTKVTVIIFYTLFSFNIYLILINLKHLFVFHILWFEFYNFLKIIFKREILLSLNDLKDRVRKCMYNISVPQF